MGQVAEVQIRREPALFYRRLESKLGSSPLRTDQDVARLVEGRLPLGALESLASDGASDEEIYSLIVPRRTLAHRKNRREPLTHEGIGPCRPDRPDCVAC